ncbi:MAG: monovalent cation/H(+) antiporter subunit G [Myxococcota bacterium]
MNAIVLVILVAGVLLNAVATLGMLRLPDFYTRIHMVGKADTMGITLVLLAVAVSEGFTRTSLKLAFIIVFYFIANPAAAHALGHAALRRGLVPWTREGRSGS